MTYDCVATETSVAQLVQLVTETSSKVKMVRENESGYHFDKSIFWKPRLQQFLREKHTSDYALYEAVGSN